MENISTDLIAYTLREQHLFYAKKNFREDIPRAANVVFDILQKSKLDWGSSGSRTPATRATGGG